MPKETLEVRGETLLRGTNFANGITLSSASNTAGAGQKIAWFGANRFDKDEEACSIVGRMESNSGGSGNIQDGELAFFTSGIERVTVDKFGNVGIGKTRPKQPCTLKLLIKILLYLKEIKEQEGAQEISICWSYGDSDKDVILSSDNGSLNIYNKESSEITPTLTIKNDGNVGVGATAPAGKLDVQTANGERVTLLAEDLTNTSNQSC